MGCCVVYMTVEDISGGTQHAAGNECLMLTKRGVQI